jgi:amino acid adenylation domain-containing protein
VGCTGACLDHGRPCRDFTLDARPLRESTVELAMTNGPGTQPLRSRGTESESQSTPVVFESVLDRVNFQALQQPRAVAIVSGAEEITYGEIVRCASAMVPALQAFLGGRRGCPIAVCTDDSRHLTIAALAAWQTGCAYLPVAPSSPTERLRHMLGEADAPIVVVPQAVSSLIPRGAWKLLHIDEFTLAPKENLEQPSLGAIGKVHIAPDDIAYVIFTSGSTGTPKGVAVTHRNLNNLVAWYNNAFGVTQNDRVTQMRALTFDVSVAELWPALSAGATVYSVDRSTYLVPERLRDYLVRQEITICEAPTLLVEQLLTIDWPHNTKLRYLQTGGESLRVFPPPGLPFQVINNYGPTECTVISTSSIVTATSKASAYPSIGHPITGAEVYILDSGLQPVPNGQPGEMFIAGSGVAAGYIGRPDLTDERFITVRGIAGASRVYRTGDIARKLPNGEFEFLGRIDDQIKLRGYRIEPAEIDAALRSHPAVSAAAISTAGEGTEKQLVAYIVLKKDTSGADLRNHLALHVPAYMIPELFVPLEKMPLTQHGKIDHSALPFPSRSILLDVTSSASEPTTEIETEVASILSRVLKQSHIGFQEDFFRLGGNSLLAAQVVVQVQQVFGVDLSMRSVFDRPTVEGLAREIENRIVEASSSVIPD